MAALLFSLPLSIDWPTVLSSWEKLEPHRVYMHQDEIYTRYTFSDIVIPKT